MALRFQLLASHQAYLLSRGLQRVYGDTYPIREFYDADYVGSMIDAGRLYTVVAQEEGGEVVAQMSTVLERAGDLTADGSALMVDRAYRGRGVVAGLADAMVEVYRRCDIRGLHLYALALHDRVQNQSGNAGAVVTGILPAWFSDSARVDGYDHPAGKRIGAVCLYMPLAGLPARHAYLPAPYEGILRQLYAGLLAERELLMAPMQQASSRRSLIDSEARPDNGHVRLLVESIGDDFGRALDNSIAAACADIDVVFLDIPLTATGVGPAVSAARRAGFFFGALMVERKGGDRLRLQRYRARLASPQTMVLATAQAKVLRRFVLRDQPGSG